MLKPHSKHPLDSGTMHAARRGVIELYANESFCIWSCDRRGFVQTIPLTDEIGRFFVLNFRGDRHGALGGFANQRQPGYASKTVSPASGRRSIDIGCVNESFMQATPRKSWEVAGTERNSPDDRVKRLVVGSTSETPIEYAPVNVATLWHSLEQFLDLSSMIHSVKRIWKEGGAIIFTALDFISLRSRVSDLNQFVLVVSQRLNHFTRESITTMLEMEYFEILRTWNLEIEYEKVGWSQKPSISLTCGYTIFFSTLTFESKPSTRFVRQLHLRAGVYPSAFVAPITVFTRLAGLGAMHTVTTQVRP